ncbi:benzoate/H(+) symporter BenE family transporter [Paraburkholderia xenovorans]|uniref:benzoate/H(+) symporter BenE family transporter n=1 Tax=Paraburkholderia xenovorans TaxID=36873 RepID=UPI001559A781|nr:benzoate/H(+) symporter BenE family transporter [Paraburkholderia xenovorans]NPT39039.1 benzoate/H(+) symporter BenE family transporter [Paraburkholderia xenovorans]
MFSRMRADFSASAAIAGGIALVATYSGPVLIVVQAAQAGHLSRSLLSTWIWAVSIGAGLLGLWLSLRHRMPVIGAWSTPGVALLITGLAHYPFSDVIGCYLVVTVIIAILGLSGLFGRLIQHLPAHLLSAMIAGVLFEFCAGIFRSLQSTPAVVLPVIVAYLACRRFIPRYAVALALLTGVILALPGTNFTAQGLDLTIVKPELTLPSFSVEALVGLGLPLLLLALTQYATSIHILRNAGYDISPKSVVGASGLMSIPLALFGNSGINPAAIVGAMCASPECHENPQRRYISGVVCGVGYLCVGTFGASVIALFARLPAGLTSTLAGLALLGTLVTSLSSSVAAEADRESSVITFVVTVSGMSFFGLGSALWGLVAGVVFSLVLSKKPLWRPAKRADANEPKTS